MVKRRGGLKPGESPLIKTDFSFSDQWLEDRKFGRWSRIQVKFPFIEDRRAGNTDYASPELHREYRGNVPKIPMSRGDLTIDSPESWDDQRYIFVSDAPNGSNIPEGFYATSSGISPITVEPFNIPFYGYSTDNPVQVGADFNNDVTSAEFLYARYIITENYRGERYPYIYEGPENVGRFEWQINPEFDNPTEPSVRYPKKGASKRKPKFWRNS